MSYQEFLEKQLASFRKKYDDAEAGHNETGERRCYNAMKKNEMFVKALESAMDDEKAMDNGKAEYRRKCKNLYQTCKNIAQRDDPARAVQMILGVLSQEAE